jgi:hypothetical protein
METGTTTQDKVRLVYIDTDGRRTRYRISDGRGWMEFELFPDRRVASHGGGRWSGGGSLWPHDFPAIFEGSANRVRAEVVLPEHDPENTWGAWLEEGR